MPDAGVAQRPTEAASDVAEGGVSGAASVPASPRPVAVVGTSRLLICGHYQNYGWTSLAGRGCCHEAKQPKRNERGWGATAGAEYAQRSKHSPPAPQAKASAKHGRATEWNERVSSCRSVPAVKRRERSAEYYSPLFGKIILISLKFLPLVGAFT